MAEDRLAGTHQIISSGALATLHLLLAYSYFTDLARASNASIATGRRVSIVAYIDNLGPLWQLGFGLSGAAIALSLLRTDWLASVHTIAGAVMATYATALWIGFTLSEPRPSIVSALGYTACVAWHLTIGVTYARMHSGRRKKPTTTRWRRQWRQLT